MSSDLESYQGQQIPRNYPSETRVAGIAGCMPSVLQPWVMELPLRYQGVIVSAVRGCDTAPRDEASKLLARSFRCETLVASVGDNAKSVSFIQKVDDVEVGKRMVAVLKSHDHLPLHYWMHVVHAAEILGYYHPDMNTRALWNAFYEKACDKLHMSPETKQQLSDRLTADEESFGLAQQTTI